jgi:hypothetical protein
MLGRIGWKDGGWGSTAAVKSHNKPAESRTKKSKSRNEHADGSKPNREFGQMERERRTPNHVLKGQTAKTRGDKKDRSEEDG